MKSKTENLCEVALEVVERFNEGTLAGPGDSRAIMELQQLAKDILDLFKKEEKKTTPYIKGMQYKLLCSCGQKDCEPGLLCVQNVSRVWNTNYFVLVDKTIVRQDFCCVQTA